MRLLSIVICSIVLLSCHDVNSLEQISSEKSIAESVYLTRDHNDHSVIVWTERAGDNLTLLFAVSADNGRSFSRNVQLPLTNDVATHAESMPKIAFKKDGAIIAAYEKKSPTQANKFAGSICYRISHDGGKTWDPEKFLHSDTVGGRSRSYFDLERLSDGEIGAAWLDIKLNQQTGGRSVGFARTKGALGFGEEVIVDSSACQCCRIDVYNDLTGRVNVAYRGLMQGTMGQPIRDMMIASSEDGRAFTAPMKISQDNWMIDGCPHTGPSLCSSKGGLYSLWYTQGGGTGLFYSFKPNGTNEFNKRELISSNGRHPQVSAGDTRFIMVWEEATGEEKNSFTNIMCQVSNEQEVIKHCLSPQQANAFAPVVTPTGDGFLVAFLMETAAGTGVYTKKL